MPVYGAKIIGEAAFTAALQAERLTANNVYGPRVQNAPASVEAEAPMSPEPAPLLPSDDEADPSDYLFLDQPRTNLLAAQLRVQSVLGEGYSVHDAELLLQQSPDFWRDVLFSEVVRSEALPPRKGIIKLLAEQQGDDLADELDRAYHQGLVALAGE